MGIGFHPIGHALMIHTYLSPNPPQVRAIHIHPHRLETNLITIAVHLWLRCIVPLTGLAPITL